MGRDRVRFRCHQCLYCCTKVICLPTPWDIIQLVKASGRDPLSFVDFVEPDEIEGVAKSDPTWLKCGGKRYMMALKRDKDGKKGCAFLDKKTGGCIVYEARPILCRLFPFKLHETKDGEFKAFSLHRDVECPRYRDGEHATGPLYELYLEDAKHHEDYDELVEVFNRQRHERPEEFLDMFIVRSGRPKQVSSLGARGPLKRE